MLMGRITTQSVITDSDVERVYRLTKDHLGERHEEIADDIFEVNLTRDEVVIYYYMRDENGEKYFEQFDRGLAFDTDIRRRKDDYDYDHYKDLIAKEDDEQKEEEGQTSTAE